jgi:hypothetical protein
VVAFFIWTFLFGEEAMKVSPFEVPAPPAAADRSSGQRRQTDAVPLRAATRDEDEGDSREEALDEPGYGHGV